MYSGLHASFGLTVSTGTAIKITVAALTALQAANGLQSGTWYLITDATHANGGSGEIYIQATDTNVLDTIGLWLYTTNFKAFGWIDFAGTMIAGDTITSVSVNAVNLLTAPVAFATTYSDLAVALAANINANVASAYTATAIKNRVVLQDKLVGIASNGFVVAAVGTNLVPANAIVFTNGQAAEILQLPCIYYLDSNQIYNFIDAKDNITYNVRDTQITSLGYNPVYHFPIGDKNAIHFFAGQNAFAGSRFNGQTFRNLFIYRCLFQDTTFETGFVIIPTTSAGALSGVYFRLTNAIRGTIDFNGSIFTYAGNNIINFSRTIIQNDCSFTFTNATVGGSTLTFGRNLSDVGFNVTGSTFITNANSGFNGVAFVKFSMLNTDTFTGSISIDALRNCVVTYTGINTSNRLTLDQQSGKNITLNYTNATINGNHNYSAEINDTAFDLTGVNMGALTLNDTIKNSSIDISNCTLGDFTMANSTIDGYNMDGNSTNFGATFDITFNRVSLKNGSINLPVFGAGTGFELSDTIIDNKFVSLYYKVIGIDGTANNGLVNGAIVLGTVPAGFLATSITFEFANGLVGVGSELIAGYSTSGIVDSLLLQTAVSTLNNTVHSNGSAVIQTLNGTISNYKAISWQSIIITPLLANLTAGQVVVKLSGYIA